MERVFYILGVTITTLLTVYCAHTMCSKKRSLPICILSAAAAAVLSAAIMLAGSLVPSRNVMDLFFVLSLLPAQIYILAIFEGAFFQKVFTSAMIFLFINLASCLFMALPNIIPFALNDAILTAILFLALLPVLRLLKKPLRDIFSLTKPAVFFIMSIYPLLASTILSIWRDSLRSTSPVQVILLILFAASGAIILLFALSQMRSKMILENEKRLIIFLKEAERENYRILKASVESASIANHDSRHHIRTVKSLLAENKYNEISAYLNKLDNYYLGLKLPQMCANPAVDAVLKYYMTVCRNEKTEFECNAALPENIGVSDTDIGGTLSNALENALKAIRCIDDPLKKKLSVSMEIIQNILVLKVSNPCPDDYSRMQAGAGLGLKSIEQTALKYGGRYEMVYNDSGANLTVLFQCIKKDN